MNSVAQTENSANEIKQSNFSKLASCFICLKKRLLNYFLLSARQSSLLLLSGNELSSCYKQICLRIYLGGLNGSSGSTGRRMDYMQIMGIS